MQALCDINVIISFKREFFIDNLLARIHFILVMIRWTGLVPWEFEFPFPGSLTSTFLTPHRTLGAGAARSDAGALRHQRSRLGGAENDRGL